jgi:hydroxyacylglutathione hydrolase
MIEVSYARALRDNYVWLLKSPEQRCAIVDPGEAAPVLEVLEREELEPAAILITHHHPDHVGGAAALQERFDIPMYGPDDDRIPGNVHRLKEGDQANLESLGMTLDVFEIPGHTKTHIAFYGRGLLLSGDTLFSIGCGKLFEGTPEQMTASLDKLMTLPGNTRVYCGHEYTLANCAFARQVEPGNDDLREHEERARERLDRGEPSLPSTLDQERAANPFVRVREPTVIRAAEERAGRSLDTPEAVFAEIRAWKDAG